MSQAKKLKKKYPSLSEDLKELRERLKDDPVKGNDALGASVYKVRMELTDKVAGKSGGARVIIQVFVQDNEIHFLSIYDKSSKGSLSEGELERILKKKILFWERRNKNNL